MAGATVIVPLATLHRTFPAATVWPVNVPVANLHRHPLTPSMSLAATVVVPLLAITRHMAVPTFNNFDPATSVVTFDIQRGPQVFAITKDIVTPG